ncbi:MAG: 3-hydroxybutyrate oligomer hydrolase family protein, partial [Thermodesulfobacteriota bacterium]
MNEKPDFIRGEIVSRQFDGVSDDLLTGGFGKTGLTHPPPPFEDPEFPTSRELRSHSIHNNYRGLMDLSPAGGYGLLYGPGVSAAGIPVEGEGMVPGKEYLAYADDGTGRQSGVLMVQIPDGFDPENPCIVAAASSGSRGIYGAVGVVGEWALKRSFAAVYTDKGTGIGIHDLDSNTVNTLTGERTDAASAGRSAHFRARMNDPDEFRRVYPHRIAFKHAHSRQNPEKDWGRYLLQAIRFAFYILNLPENFGRADDRGIIRETILPKDTLVIASGISNGGGAAIRAAEQDTDGLIDGVAVSEPNVTPPVNPDLVIQQGKRVWRYPNHSRSLLDYHT